MDEKKMTSSAAAEHSHEHPHDHDHAHAHPHPHDHDHPHDHEHGHVHSHEHTRAVVNRLSRAAGHLNSVKRMVEEGKDCSEVLIQLAAVRSAINGICEIILKDHIDHCIVDAVRTGDTEAVEALNKAIKQLMKP